MFVLSKKLEETRLLHLSSPDSITVTMCFKHLKVDILGEKVELSYICISHFWSKGPTFFASLCVIVFHGDVYCVRVLRGSMACVVSVLLAGSPEDPVLDWCSYLPGHA